MPVALLPATHVKSVDSGSVIDSALAKAVPAMRRAAAVRIFLFMVLLSLKFMKVIYKEGAKTESMIF